jgi:hypothetical protein
VLNVLVLVVELGRHFNDPRLLFIRMPVEQEGIVRAALRYEGRTMSPISSNLIHLVRTMSLRGEVLVQIRKHYVLSLAYHPAFHENGLLNFQMPRFNRNDLKAFFLHYCHKLCCILHLLLLIPNLESHHNAVEIEVLCSDIVILHCVSKFLGEYHIIQPYYLMEMCRALAVLTKGGKFSILWHDQGTRFVAIASRLADLAEPPFNAKNVLCRQSGILKVLLKIEEHLVLELFQVGKHLLREVSVKIHHVSLDIFLDNRVIVAIFIILNDIAHGVVETLPLLIKLL